jgi:hypothetical protein
MLTIFALILLVLAPSLAFASDHETKVRGHFRRDGTYVEPHHRTTPDDSARNNWSSTPNVNPRTGEAGNRDPYKIERERDVRPEPFRAPRGRAR